MYYSELELIKSLDFSNDNEISKALYIIEKYKKSISELYKSDSDLFDKTIKTYLKDLCQEAEGLLVYLPDKKYDIRGGLSTLRVILEIVSVIYYRYYEFSLFGKKDIEIPKNMPRFPHRNSDIRGDGIYGLDICKITRIISRCESFKLLYSYISDNKSHYRNKKGNNDIFTKDYFRRAEERICVLNHVTNLKKSIVIILIEVLVFTLDIVDMQSYLNSHENEYFLSKEDVCNMFNINYNKFNEYKKSK